MIMNPKIGDYIWFICRWTDLPVLGQVTSLKIDPANKNFPYERPYAEVDWYNGENPSEPGPWCGSTSVLLKDLYKTKQELLDSIKFSTTRSQYAGRKCRHFFLKILHIVYVAQKINKRGDKYEKDCISDINNPDDYLYGTGNHP